MESHYTHNSQQQYLSNQQSDEQKQHGNTKYEKMFIQKNSEEEQEIVIPYWDEDSSSHYQLIEEIKALRKTIRHFQSHMNRMKLEYEQLKINLQQMDQNEKQHLRRYNQLTQRYNNSLQKIQQLKTELQGLKHRNNDLSSDLKAKQIYDEENKKKINKIKDQQLILINKIHQLESENKINNFRNDQEKKIMERNFVKQLELLKNNYELNNSKFNENTIFIEQLIRKSKEKDDKYIKLQKQYYQLLSEQSILTKQLLDKKNQIHLLTEQRNHLKTHCNRLQHYQPQKPQPKKKSLSTITRTLSMIWTGLQPLPPITSDTTPKYFLKQKQQQISKLKKQIKQLQTKLLQQIKGKLQLVGKLQNKINQKDHEILQFKIQMENIRNFVKQREYLQEGLGVGGKEYIKGNLEIEKQISLIQLQTEYNTELQALKRLLLYKRYPQPSTTDIEARLRIQYQNKFDLMVIDYQQLQKQLLILQEQFVLQKRHHQHQVEQTIRFQSDEQERLYLLQAIRKWQIAYQQLHTIYETKLISKDQEINLLTLKLTNLG